MFTYEVPQGWCVRPLHFSFHNIIAGHYSKIVFWVCVAVDYG